jgi:hypothetical protein
MSFAYRRGDNWHLETGLIVFGRSGNWKLETGNWKLIRVSFPRRVKKSRTVATREPRTAKGVSSVSSA